MKRTFAIVAFLSLFLMSAVWIDPASCQTWTFKLGNATAPDHAYNVGARKYAELVAQRTGNKVKIDIYPATQLGSERDLVEGLQLGTVDLVVTSTGPLGGFVPKMFVVDLPFLFRDKEHAYKVLDGPIGKGLLDAFSAKGIKGLAFWENGFRTDHQQCPAHREARGFKRDQDPNDGKQDPSRFLQGMGSQSHAHGLG